MQMVLKANETSLVQSIHVPGSGQAPALAPLQTLANPLFFDTWDSFNLTPHFINMIQTHTFNGITQKPFTERKRHFGNVAHLSYYRLHLRMRWLHTRNDHLP